MAEQIPLFQDEYVLLNNAVGALATLDLDTANQAFHDYSDLYRVNGNVSGLMLITDFLRRGLSNAPEHSPDEPQRLFRLWKSFESYAREQQLEHLQIIPRIRLSFFHLIVKAIKDGGVTDSTNLSPGFPVGYAYLQTGQYDRAVPSLQAALAETPDNTVVYGYLGDAYWLRGEEETARKIYFEACLIDPEALDWEHLRDNALKTLQDSLTDEYGYEPPLACQWLPSYAYIRGLFKPKKIRLREEFKAFVDGYLALKKISLKTPSPQLCAKLFARGIVLCDNETFLHLLKGIDFAEIRREMKTANDTLFKKYLNHLERRGPLSA